MELFVGRLAPDGGESAATLSARFGGSRDLHHQFALQEPSARVVELIERTAALVVAGTPAQH